MKTRTLSQTQTARMLNVRLADLREMREDGTGPPFTVRHTEEGEPLPPRYRGADIEAWIDEQYGGGLL